MATRKRAYGARLLLDHVDMILDTAAELGLPIKAIGDLSPSKVRGIISQVPSFDIERELAVKVESEDRALNENDLRDFAALSVVLPYADTVVAEKAFMSRARQAGLGRRYQTQLLTSLTALDQI